MNTRLDQGLDPRNYEKHGETRASVCLVALTFSNVDSVAIAPLNITTQLTTTTKLFGTAEQFLPSSFHSSLHSISYSMTSPTFSLTIVSFRQ
jgi:hypothetical protein